MFAELESYKIPQYTVTKDDDDMIFTNDPVKAIDEGLTINTDYYEYLWILLFIN